MKSLKATGHQLADTGQQLQILEHGLPEDPDFRLVPFQQKLSACGLYPLKPTALEVFQVNIGKMCNQVCRHCHVDAGPDRKEIMTRDTMRQCINIISNQHSFNTVDITGGAPEMNPDFKWFIEQIREVNSSIKIIVRCNLTIILANKKYHDLPEFYKKHRLEIVSSLPFYTADRTDRQRGDGVFEQSIKALQLLNETGYGRPGTGLTLNLVYNPAGAFLPASQESLEAEYKHELRQHYDIEFNQLFTITNMPISRYLEYLLQSGNYEDYMEKLLAAFNAQAAVNVMCRNTLSIGWDGFIYDCDFNQMLELKVSSPSNHISEFNANEMSHRNIIVGQHCYGCTAGSGSSCGGTVA